MFAYDPDGLRHRVPEQLESLFMHAGAREFVGSISGMALRASAAPWARDGLRLADAIRRYVSVFDEWSGGRDIHESVGRMAARLAGSLGDRLIAFKPPGAGAAPSLVALVADGAISEALGLLGDSGWVATPVVVTGGLRCEIRGRGGDRTSARHRIDLVGAADLSSEPPIRRGGICCSIAVEPRCEIMIWTPGSGATRACREAAA